MVPARRIVTALSAFAALAAASAGPAVAAGPISKGLTATSSKALRSGVTLSQFTMQVNDHGHMRTVKVWKVTWKAGNPHVRLDSALLGGYNADDRSVKLGRISSWAKWGAGSGLVAAVNGDYFADSWQHYGSGRPSGLLIHDRHVYSFGWGGPAAGFKAGGDLVMGRPQAVPAQLSLPGGKQATIGSFGALPARGDQVGVYSASSVTIPAGGTGFVVDSTAPAGLLHGARTQVNHAGLNMSEPIAGFRIEDPSAAYRTVALSFLAPPTCASGVCPAGSHVQVDAGSVVLVARAGGLAATGLASKVAAHGSAALSLDDAGWDGVDDVMGGKPQLVNNGYAIASRPSFVDPWQWSESHWRPALVKGTNGTAWLAVEGASGGNGVWADTWAKMLVQMGARSAMAFDNNSSTELFRPGVTPITAFGWERSIPSAIALSYTP